MSVKVIRQLLKYLVIYKKDLTIVMVALCSVAMTLLMVGQGFKKLVDSGLNKHNTSEANEAILFICLLIVIFGVGSFFRSYFINNIAEKVTNNIRVDAFHNLIKHNLVFFEDLKIGDLISCLSADVELISKLIVDFLSFFIRNFIMLIGGIVMMFSQSPKLCFIVIIIVPLLLIPLLKLGKQVRALSKSGVNMQGQIAGSIEETFVNIQTVYAYNQQNNKIEDFEKQVSSYLNFTSNKLRLRSIFFASAISVIMLCITIVIWAGSNDIIAGNITSGHMLSFIYYSIVTGTCAGGIAELFNEVQTPLAATERVFSLINLSNDDNTSINSQILINKNDVIEFNQVTFSYPTRPTVLDKLSFKIPLGKFIGIVGKSGAGKSTIFQLLLKFYYSYNGSISIAGNDIITTSSVQIRNLIAYVPQMPSIFSGTIRSNIAFSNPSASYEDVLRAAELSFVTDFTNTLKDGLDTEIGERGIRLSGGQKQRIAIARAILYNPQILLLDEATSSLDSNSEQTILDNLRKIMVGKTIISIAHRIASIEEADEILLIDQGRMLAKGTHQELITRSKLYQVLCEEQLVYT